MQLHLKTSALCIIAGLAIACGANSKHHNGTKNPDDHGSPGSTDVLKIDPTGLTLSSDGYSTPNEFTVDATGRAKVEAQFQLNADASYALQLTSIHNDVADCSDQPSAPEFTWIESNPAKSTQLKQGTEFSAKKGESYILAVTFDNIRNCKSVHVAFGVTGTKAPAQPNPTPQPDGLGDVTFAQEAVIREFGTDGTDTAALFIIRPSDVNYLNDVKVSNVRGPQFLGNPGVGIMNETLIGKVFNKGSNPMDYTKKQRLLEDYRGAAVVYFEGYTGHLCSGQELEVIVTSTLREVTLTSDFKFVATPTQGNCHIAQASMITTYQE